MKKTVLKTYCMLSCIMIFFCKLYGQDQFQVIQSNINQHLKAAVQISQLEQTIATFFPKQQKDGSWQDIHYASRMETSWPPLLHLKRLNHFTLHFVINDQPDDNQPDILTGIVNGLRYWVAQNPASDNWFQNDIAVPMALGEILILLNNGQPQLPIGLKDTLLQRMQQGDVYKSVGANKLDIATHLLYRACVTKDTYLMKIAVEQAFSPIGFTSREGLQYDYSYLQHGPQLQISSYGEVFLKGAYKVATWLQGTDYALPADQLKMLNHYFINTYLKTIRGRYIDFNTEGRGISRNDILDKIVLTENAGENTLLALAKKLSPENVELFDAARERILQQKDPSYKILQGHTHFWKADYTLHTQPAYSFNVRMVSRRTIRTESGNDENLLGKFLPDGSTNIQRSGSEYFNIMPVWEWDKIPGVTSRDYQQDQPMTIKWGERGIRSFVGGVSDSIYGASVCTVDYNEVTAKKAWFFFDQQVLCLGAGINSFAPENIATTINQSWRKGKVIAYADKRLANITTSKSLRNATWVWHDSIGYYFPDAGKLEISNQQQKGSWSLINANRSKEQLKGNVFKLWINHGQDPLNAHYAYIVVPGVGATDMNTRQVKPIKILVNNTAMQAAKQEALNMIQVVFYEPGTLTDDQFSITADQPCIVLIKNANTSKPVIHLADPTQRLQVVNIHIRSKWMLQENRFKVTLPVGDFAGASVKYFVN